MNTNEKQRSFLLLVNPISGTKNKDAAVKYIMDHVAKQGFAIVQEVTNAKGDYTELMNKINSENITDVIIIGGDGTINTVMNTLRHAKINVGIIPSGSGNGLAYTANIPKDYKKALAIILKGHTQTIDGFMCNNNFACMLCGIGFDAQVAHDFSKQKSRGLATYTKQSIKNFLSAKPFAFDITIGHKTISTEAFFISIANSNQFGNNFTIAPRASLSDGLLDIVIVQKMSKLKLPLAILQQLRGKNKYAQLSDALEHSNIVYLQTESITIENKQNAPLHIDGEAVQGFASFQFEVLKQCFTIYVP